MPDEQREKMVMGGKASRAVDAYLRYVVSASARGRKVDTVALQVKIDAEDNLARKTIFIAQLREAERRVEEENLSQELEDEFLKYAAWFSEQHGITYAVWREMGVEPAVLKRAGISS